MTIRVQWGSLGYLAAPWECCSATASPTGPPPRSSQSNLHRVSVSRSPTLFAAVAAVAVLVGCGEPGERVAELPAGSGEGSGVVLHDADDAAVEDADIDDADVGDVAVDGDIGGDGVGDDAVEVEAYLTLRDGSGWDSDRIRWSLAGCGW